MTRFRLLADDLTGALDSAARFCPSLGALPVGWADDAATAMLVLDGATRDLGAAAARARVASLAPTLAAADIAFKKLDSLLRGHVAAEIAVCLAAGGYNAVVIAPAFPAQGRITRHGRQLAHGHDVGVDLITALAAEGLQAARRHPGDDLPAGVSLWDAETDADLATIAAMGRGRVLWCGTGGLAGALCATLGTVAAPVPLTLPHPILALSGSDHPVARAQLDACNVRVSLGAGHSPALVHGSAVDIALPDGLDRAEAARRIAQAFAALLGAMERPGTLIVVGGETLHAICRALGAEGLLVEGEIAPGVPASRLRGGRWDGLRIVSKSGAFGDVGLLNALLAGMGEQPQTMLA